ncbi:MAG TPA: hypothetical protein VIK01_13665 [Polyangiaceae bacterium]
MLLSHCSPGPSASQKAEAGRISHAVDALRDAPNSAKQQLFAALRDAACETPDLCALKQQCVTGFAQHLRALGETARAKALLMSPGNEKEAAKALTAAETGLTQAAPEITKCTDLQGAAQRKYKP